MLKVNEMFYSIQGEGPNIGKPAVFLRLSGCNLSCPWCDTKYAWTEGYEMSVEDVKRALSRYRDYSFRLVITGGEPMLQQKEISKLLQNMHWIHVEIETNGTIEPMEDLLWYVDSWVISPKLHENYEVRWHHKIPLSMGYQYSTLHFKYVIDEYSDVKKVWERHGNANYVILMPQAATREEHERKFRYVCEWAKTFGYRVLPRLHILAWDNVRGK